MKTSSEIEQIRAKIIKIHQDIDMLITDYRQKYGDIAIVLVKDQPEVTKRPWRGVMISPYTGGDGIRLSYFDADGFSGHTVYKTEHEAIFDGYYDWRPCPELMDKLALDERFQRGNSYCLALEQLRNKHRRINTSSERTYQEECDLRNRFYGGDN